MYGERVKGVMRARGSVSVVGSGQLNPAWLANVSQLAHGIRDRDGAAGAPAVKVQWMNSSAVALASRSSGARPLIRGRMRVRLAMR